MRWRTDRVTVDAYGSPMASTALTRRHFVVGKATELRPDLSRRCPAVDPDAHHLFWMEAGRCYERFALQAAALGIRSAFLNQPVEVAAIRPRFTSLLGVAGKRPDLVVRFGRGPAMPASLRHDVDSVLA